MVGFLMQIKAVIHSEFHLFFVSTCFFSCTILSNKIEMRMRYVWNVQLTESREMSTAAEKIVRVSRTLSEFLRILKLFNKMHVCSLTVPMMFSCLILFVLSIVRLWHLNVQMFFFSILDIYLLLWRLLFHVQAHLLAKKNVFAFLFRPIVILFSPF